MNMRLDMTEADIVRAMKTNKYSPLQLVAARYFKENPDDVDADYDSVVIWNDSINDYHSYRYCVEDINTIKSFLDEWNDYADGHLVDFALSPISFCVEQGRR